ncbi:WD40 repeat domain-containing protein [Actinacidiphila acididurans]|uniref:PQQ-binding-like beta-propeller repeat protein n=1 Tax=Actinacidiphila acididurans TaxID=2784346 RepID=A0ABS2TKD1_9ACTN|nr:PQQ-binding-like beta-propeller repeat protein [Actinacidiphila acididurans]MBM9503800.1 PQQ-binding-like beta-propeller repeat protein [Actinacidiphila acididurans]
MLKPLRARPTVTIAAPGQFAVPELAHDSRGGVVLLSTGAGYDVRRWDAGTGEPLWHFPGTDLVSAVTVAHPAGRGPVVAVATDMGVERLDADSGEAVPDEDMAEVDTIWDITSGPLPGGQAYVAGAGHCNGLVHHWDAATAQPLGPLTGHGYPVKTITSATLPDGTALIASQDEVGVVLRWNAATGQPFGKPVHGPAGYNMRMIALSLPDGRAVLASLDMNGVLSRWDAATGEEIGTPLELGENATAVTGACLEGDGRLLVSTLDGVFQVRDIVTGAVTNSEFPGVNPAVLRRPDGFLLLAVSDTSRSGMRLYDLSPTSA